MVKINGSCGNQTMNMDGAATIALQALGEILADAALRTRFLDITGTTAEDLRRRLDDPSLLAAVMAFLSGHEPDLIACAQALGRPPEQLKNASNLLQGAHD